jgi:hypothetical protein
MIYQVHLLEAEQFSFQNCNSKAQASYSAAINSDCSSGFIHEQGSHVNLLAITSKRFLMLAVHGFSSTRPNNAI